MRKALTLGCTTLMASTFIVSSALSQTAAQKPPAAPHSAAEPSPFVLPLAEDRGRLGLERSLKQLGTTASVLMIVAHPDDEDGALLTYLTRGLGARATLLTLTRGEGGQNAMSAESYDALGLLRSSELVKADQYYGVNQLWGSEADFGFSKTSEESFARWSRSRVLYDAVLAVRSVRPQIILASFSGALTDGHGQHQVSGEAAQLAFRLAADPTVFPEQLKNGLTPWQPLAVYSRTPQVNAKDGKIFDYATGKLEPVLFRNYVTGEEFHTQLTTEASINTGQLDPALGRSYAQIAREGWGEQKSQYGGANPALSGPVESNYHLWAARPEATASGPSNEAKRELFRNQKVSINTSVAGLLCLAGPNPPAALARQLQDLDQSIANARSAAPTLANLELAHRLAALLKQTTALQSSVKQGSLDVKATYDLSFELEQKIHTLQTALANLLGLDLVAYRANGSGDGAAPQRGSADETPRAVTPGQQFQVRLHMAHAEPQAQLVGYSVESHSGAAWLQQEQGQTPDTSPATSQKLTPAGAAQADAAQAEITERTLKLTVSSNAQPTAPAFSRPSIEQPFYDLADTSEQQRSFAHWPLTAQAVYRLDDVLIPVNSVVQTMQRTTGPGGVYQPLVVTPSIGVSLTPEARVLPLDGSPIQVQVRLHAEQAASGSVQLELPAGWQSTPAQLSFTFQQPGDSAPLCFRVQPAHNLAAGSFTLTAVASSQGQNYRSGWQSIGYTGLIATNYYRPAQLKARQIPVSVRPGLRIGYVMGTGDFVPQALEELGLKPHLLSAADLATADLSVYTSIVVGIRAYSNRPDLVLAQPRLDEFVKNGGTLVVQYQSANFPAPLPIALGRIPERVVDESTPVRLLAPTNALLTTPNRINTADFDGWVEERGHSFADSWDPGYTALTETADQGQNPQRGGLLLTHPGKGTYIYVAFALHRQLPELVPGSYRLLANLVSAAPTR